MKQALLLFICLLTAGILPAQNAATGKILVICDTDADVIVDGDKRGTTTAGNAFKVELDPGEHYVQVQGLVNEKMLNNGQTVQVEAGKQQIIRLNLLTSGVPATASISPVPADTINLATVDFTIAGAIAVGLWMGEHPDEDYPDYPVYYYILDKDDILVLDFKMDNKKGTNVIAIESYPDGNDLYTDNNLVVAKNLTVKIPARGIYGISFATNHAFDRSCNLRVRKIPASVESKSLSPAVGWKTRADTIFKWMTDTIENVTLKPVTLQAPLKSWVNSGSNAFFGGRSRITIPLTLPANTIEWYYIVSAYRDEEQMTRTMGSFNLLADIATAIDATGVAGFGINLLTQPPGADYCDVFLLDEANERPFYNHEAFSDLPEGTRVNVTSGLVKITGITRGKYYLGLRNPDSYYGEFVAIEVVAVTKEIKREVKRERRAIRIQEKKYPVIPG